MVWNAQDDIRLGQGSLEQGQQPAPGPLRLRFVVHLGIRRAPDVQGPRVDFDLRREPRLSGTDVRLANYSDFMAVTGLASFLVHSCMEPSYCLTCLDNQL